MSGEIDHGNSYHSIRVSNSFLFNKGKLPLLHLPFHWNSDLCKMSREMTTTYKLWKQCCHKLSWNHELAICEPLLTNHETLLTNHEPLRTKKEPLLTNHEPLFTNHEPLLRNHKLLLTNHERTTAYKPSTIDFTVNHCNWCLQTTNLV